MAIDLLRPRGSGEVEILRFGAEQKVTDAAAHPEGGKAGGLEAASDPGSNCARRRIHENRLTQRRKEAKAQGIH
jgi:hypothetical protein